MKNIYFLLISTCFILPTKAQNNDVPVRGLYCYNDNINNANIDILQPVTVRVNTIVLYRDDGSGNFKLLGSDEESMEQSKVFMEFLDYTNHVYSNFVKPTNYNNCGYNDTEFFSDMKIRITNNVIPISNTYYWNMRNGGTDLTANPRILGNFTPSSNWYLNPLDDIIHNSSNHPKAINSYFTSDGVTHDSVVKTKGNYWPFNEAAAGEFPSFTDFNKSSRPHVPLRLLKYFFHKYKLTQQYNTTWIETRNGHINDARGYIAHELGHNFNLGHLSNCNNNLMKPAGSGEGSAMNFLTPTQIRTVHDNLTKTNLIQFVTEDSYYNAGLKITQDQTWNGKRRIYSDLIIESGANLILKGDLIMPPQSKIYIRNGGTLTLDGGIILSADNKNWGGLYKSAQGNFTISSNTNSADLYANSYFEIITNTNNTTPCFSAIIQEKESNLADKIKVYPNPSDGNIHIEIDDLNFEGARISIYNYMNQEIASKNMTQQKTSFNLAHTPKGNYIIIIEKEAEKISKQLIIK